jgi:aspartyl-tRNA(Asn)/glutamyl-tRNA(Gln) amidotransferase subunit C
MANFTADDVRRLAALARLELTTDEIDRFARQLGEILDFARQVQEAEAAAFAVGRDQDQPAGTTLPPLPPFRDDAVQPCLARDVVLAAAPNGDPATGLFKVPRVFTE